MLGLSEIYHHLDLLRNKISYNLSEVFSLLFVKIYLAVLLLQNISIWGFVWLFARRVGSNLTILHFTVDFGIDLVGDAKKLFTIPVLGLFVSVLNFSLLFVFLKNKNFKFIAHLLLATALMVNVFLSLSLGPIYWMNFRQPRTQNIEHRADKRKIQTKPKRQARNKSINFKFIKQELRIEKR